MNVNTTQSPEIKKTWKPKAAGIIDINVGCLSLIAAIGIFIFGAASSLILGLFGGMFAGATNYSYFVGPASVIALPLFALGMLAIIGGIFALTRKIWIFALVGSIAGVLLWIVYILWMGFSPPQGTRLEFFVLVVFLSIVFLPIWLPGIIAIVLTIQSKKEFK